MNKTVKVKNLEIDLTYPKGHEKEGKPMEKVCVIGVNPSDLPPIENGFGVVVDWFDKYSGTKQKGVVNSFNESFAMPQKFFYTT